MNRNEFLFFFFSLRIKCVPITLTIYNTAESARPYLTSYDSATDSCNDFINAVFIDVSFVVRRIT